MGNDCNCIRYRPKDLSASGCRLRKTPQTPGLEATPTGPTKTPSGPTKTPPGPTESPPGSTTSPKGPIKAFPISSKPPPISPKTPSFYPNSPTANPKTSPFSNTSLKNTNKTSPDRTGTSPDFTGVSLVLTTASPDRAEDSPIHTRASLRTINTSTDYVDIASNRYRASLGQKSPIFDADEKDEELISNWEQTGIQLFSDFKELLRQVETEARRECEGRSGVECWQYGDREEYWRALLGAKKQAEDICMKPGAEELYWKEERRERLAALQQLLSEISRLYSSFPDSNCFLILRSLLSKSALYDAFQVLLASYKTSHRQFHSEITTKLKESPLSHELNIRLQRLVSMNIAIHAVDDRLTVLVSLIMRVIKLAKDGIASFERVERLEKAAKGELEKIANEDIEEEILIEGEMRGEHSEWEMEEYMRLLALSKQQCGVLYSLLARSPATASDEADTTDLLLAVELVFAQHCQYPQCTSIEYTVLSHFLSNFPADKVAEKATLFVKGLDRRRGDGYIALVCKLVNLHPPPYNQSVRMVREVVEMAVAAKGVTSRPSDPSKWSQSGGIIRLKDLLALIYASSALTFQSKTHLIWFCKPSSTLRLTYSRLLVLFAISYVQTESYNLSKLHFPTLSHRLTPVEVAKSLRGNSRPELCLPDQDLLDLLTSFLDANSQTMVRKHFTKGLDLAWFVAESGKKEYDVPVVKYLTGRVEGWTGDAAEVDFN